MNELISVIIPVYNTAKWLEKCIASVQNQTWTRLEIIIVDDGSTDGSYDLAQRLAQSDRRIQVCRQPNRGASAARNLGLSKASGAYIGFVDSDDAIAPEMYARLRDLMRRENLLMAQASRQERDESGNRLPDVCRPPEQETILPDRAFIRELLLHQGDASFCTKLISASLFETARFPEGLLNEDFRLLIALLPQAGRVGILPEQYYYVLNWTNSTTRKREDGQISRVYLDIVDNADMMEALTAREYPELVPEAKRFALYQRLEYLLHVPISQMRRDNGFYRGVVAYLRANIRQISGNPYLGRKWKLYLLLFAIAPKTIRVVHAFSKGKGFRG